MKIVLLSDATMNANAGGLSQTLYNLFLFTDPKNLLCITSDKAMRSCPPTEPFSSRYISYRFETLETPSNRLAKYIRPYVDWLNYSYSGQIRSFSSIRKQIQDFNPDIAVSCSKGPMGILMHHRLLRGLNIKKVFPYFMDDWMNQEAQHWWGGNTHQGVRKLLAENPSWLMISKELSTVLQERYGVCPERVLDVHNPVDLSNAPIVSPVQKKESYTLAYAGALWPMHIDALKVIAESVKVLKEKREVNLILYTSAYFWNWRKTELEPLGVSYGGNIPYQEIHQKLAEADALIVASSFSKEWDTYSKSSVQTKITDYLKSQRLIIACGPVYAANHHFLNRHKCGVCIETNDIAPASAQLNFILDHLPDYQDKIENGWALLKEEFTFEKVHKRLEHFLAGSD
jgi:glycosyltransferase involved in cell wall biosynthesis